MKLSVDSCLKRTQYSLTHRSTRYTYLQNQRKIISNESFLPRCTYKTFNPSKWRLPVASQFAIPESSIPNIKNNIVTNIRTFTTTKPQPVQPTVKPVTTNIIKPSIPKKENNLIWVDLEMTGLDIEKDIIIEMAIIVTDENLKILAE